MRLLPLALLCAALLSACQDTAPPPRMLSADELRPMYRDLPREALPPISSSGLGETYTLGGVVKDWQASRDVALFLAPSQPGSPEGAAGTLTATGQIEVSAPLNIAQGYATKLSDLIRSEGTLCPVTELSWSSNPEVQVMVATLLVRWADVSLRMNAAALRPQTSPVPVWADLRPSVTQTSAGSRTAFLVYSPEEVTVLGENRCISGSEQGRPPGQRFVLQTQVRASVTLKTGWNALLNTEKLLSSVGKVGVVERGWTALPADELTTWTLR
ncbi:hypothetical protein [Deinococcus humi]|uniref:Uncharacterized protein n=1 Tax=Deinococcus humi TaxID=662880 RepID=A0A7W8K0V5_9DEIO|nr:hypothetical protein [Deinococcus humi]MBB5366428.1 hypothetical protein [Deinococcus humi]GGO41856.1 hypothetical protein GCM10008949_53190 [Deinococcus humi]